MADEIGPVPPALLAGARPDDIPNAQIWLNRVATISQREATTTKKGGVNSMPVIADLNQTVSSPPTQAEVQAISDKVDALLAALRTAGILETT